MDGYAYRLCLKVGVLSKGMIILWMFEWTSFNQSLLWTTNSIVCYYAKHTFIIICIIFALLYIGLVFFLAYIVKNNILNSIRLSETAATKCVTTAVTELTAYETDNQNAISDGLCAYT